MNSINSENNFILNKKPSDSQISVLKDNMNFDYPSDYFDFISLHNGGEGELGEGYLALWPIEDMIETNSIQKNEVPDFYDKYWIFGSNSGIFQYVFSKQDGTILEIDPYEESYEVIMGKSFKEFISVFKEKKVN